MTLKVLVQDDRVQHRGLKVSTVTRDLILNTTALDDMGVNPFAG